MTIDIDDAISALLAYRQADMEGVEVLTSRQAIHEVADELRRMRTLAQAAVTSSLSARQQASKILFGDIHWVDREDMADMMDDEFVQDDGSHRRRISPNALIAELEAAQPPAAPVETATKSAPELGASHNSGERLPSSDAAEAGADTRLSADNAVEKQCILGKCPTPELCNDLSWCDAKLLRDGDCLGEDGDQSGTHAGYRHKDNRRPRSSAATTYDNAAFKNTDGASAAEVLAAVRHCANSWESSARLLGNVRASDISRACTEALSVLAQPQTVPTTERDMVASWMMQNGYATGHGDTIADMLDELESQARKRERRDTPSLSRPNCGGDRG